MTPENANPKNFHQHTIIYNDTEFAIAYGEWVGKDQKESSMVLAMRWTGEEQDNEDAGYPKVFGNPMWFIITSQLRDLLLMALLLSPDSNRKNIITVLNELNP